MAGNVVVKPFVEGVIQLQRPVAVRAGISAGVPFVGIQFIEEFALDHFLEGGKRHAVKVRHQCFQTTVRKVAEFIIILQRQLRSYDRVVHRLLYDDAVLVQEHGFKRKVVGNFYDPAAVKQSGTQVCHDGLHICILSDAMSERDVPRGACCHGNGNASDVGFVRIQCAHIFISVFIGRRRFKVECDYGCVAEICVDFFDASDSLVILHIVLL